MTKLFTCPKCGGSGHISQFNHVEAGVCFQCRGTGKVDKLPVDLENAGVVDVIYSMVRPCSDSRFFDFIQFYIWHDGTGKENANTGHWMETRVDTQEVDEYSYEPRYSDQLLAESGYHVSLEAVRTKFATARKAGYELTNNLTAMLTPS